mmetsp:Transcript_45372/g.55052  ORF Transcript_45372/g.55052 Transcript_45372/m.55052 type:complete len:335 (-) Transcript_45372:120-1124(-)
MTTSFLVKTGIWVKSINKSLLDAPPPCVEQSGNDVCYLGPDGDTSNVVYCKDLEPGKRCMVASWYISPERHVIESVISISIALVLLFLSLKSIVPYPEPPSSITSPPKKHHLRPPPFLRFTTLIFCTLMVLYKSLSYPGKIYLLVMPCNLNWCMAFLLAYCNLGAHASHIICQLWISMAGLTIVAMATPDTSDLTLPGEVTYFFANHVALLLYPIYYLMSGKITVLPMSPNESTLGCFTKWWVLSCAAFTLFYMIVAAPASMYSGLNLNYMMSPPPTPGDLITGVGYRVDSAWCVYTLFFVIRGVILGIELLYRECFSCPFKVHARLLSKDKIV